MAEVCSVCGKKLGGLIGLPATPPETLQWGKERGIIVQEPICTRCFYRQVDPAESVSEENAETKRLRELTQRIPVSTINLYEKSEYSFVGPVSAHVALGTGPISQLLSSVTDFFGEQSETYNKKMEEAEAACLLKLKQKANAMGANAIVGLQTTYTELTHGHGMLLVSMIGTAIKKAPHDD